MKNFIPLTAILLMTLTSGISHASEDARVLIVLTSHTDLGNTGEKTGFWLPELTHPYYEFENAGYTVDVASINGCMAPLDAKAFAEPDEYHQTFLNDAELMAKSHSKHSFGRSKPSLSQTSSLKHHRRTYNYS